MKVRINRDNYKINTKEVPSFCLQVSLTIPSTSITSPRYVTIYESVFIYSDLFWYLIKMKIRVQAHEYYLYGPLAHRELHTTFIGFFSYKCVYHIETGIIPTYKYRLHLYCTWCYISFLFLFIMWLLVTIYSSLYL